MNFDEYIDRNEYPSDFIFPPHRYTPYLSISGEAAQNGAACISPAKTFNIAGMIDAMAIIPNERHREKFHEFAHRYRINKVNVFATAAIEAAYRDGAEWLDEIIDYIQGNVDFIVDYL